MPVFGSGIAFVLYVKKYVRVTWKSNVRVLVIPYCCLGPMSIFESERIASLGRLQVAGILRYSADTVFSVNEWWWWEMRLLYNNKWVASNLVRRNNAD